MPQEDGGGHEDVCVSPPQLLERDNAQQNNDREVGMSGIFRAEPAKVVADESLEKMKENQNGFIAEKMHFPKESRTFENEESFGSSPTKNAFSSSSMTSSNEAEKSSAFADKASFKKEQNKMFEKVENSIKMFEKVENSAFTLSGRWQNVSLGLVRERSMPWLNDEKIEVKLRPKKKPLKEAKMNKARSSTCILDDCEAEVQQLGKRQSGVFRMSGVGAWEERDDGDGRKSVEVFMHEKIGEKIEETKTEEVQFDEIQVSQSEVHREEMAINQTQFSEANIPAEKANEANSNQHLHQIEPNENEHCIEQQTFNACNEDNLNQNLQQSFTEYHEDNFNQSQSEASKDAQPFCDQEHVEIVEQYSNQQSLNETQCDDFPKSFEEEIVPSYTNNEKSAISNFESTPNTTDFTLSPENSMSSPLLTPSPSLKRRNRIEEDIARRAQELAENEARLAALMEEKRKIQEKRSLVSPISHANKQKILRHSEIKRQQDLDPRAQISVAQVKLDRTDEEQRLRQIREDLERQRAEEDLRLKEIEANRVKQLEEIARLEEAKRESRRKTPLNDAEENVDPLAIKKCVEKKLRDQKMREERRQRTLKSENLNKMSLKSEQKTKDFIPVPPPRDTESEAKVISKVRQQQRPLIPSQQQRWRMKMKADQEERERKQLEAERRKNQQQEKNKVEDLEQKRSPTPELTPPPLPPPPIPERKTPLLPLPPPPPSHRTTKLRIFAGDFERMFCR